MGNPASFILHVITVPSKIVPVRKVTQSKYYRIFCWVLGQDA